MSCFNTVIDLNQSLYDSKCGATDVWRSEG